MTKNSSCSRCDEASERWLVFFCLVFVTFDRVVCFQIGLFGALDACGIGVVGYEGSRLSWSEMLFCWDDTVRLVPLFYWLQLYREKRNHLNAVFRTITFFNALDRRITSTQPENEFNRSTCNHSQINSIKRQNCGNHGNRLDRLSVTQQRIDENQAKSQRSHRRLIQIENAASQTFPFLLWTFRTA